MPWNIPIFWLLLMIFSNILNILKTVCEKWYFLSNEGIFQQNVTRPFENIKKNKVFLNRNRCLKIRVIVPMHNKQSGQISVYSKYNTLFIHLFAEFVYVFSFFSVFNMFLYTPFDWESKIDARVRKWNRKRARNIWRKKTVHIRQYKIVWYKQKILLTIIKLRTVFRVSRHRVWYLSKAETSAIHACPVQFVFFSHSTFFLAL